VYSKQRYFLQRYTAFALIERRNYGWWERRKRFRKDYL